MYRFFTTPESTKEKSIVIVGDDVNHIKNVLRLTIGEKITVSDGCEKEYICSIKEINNQSVVADIEDVVNSVAELGTNIVLFQGYPKSDKLEVIIQKAVELGVTSIVPVMTKRTIVKLDEKKADKKIDRFNQIALAAAKQSKRGLIPEVKPVMSFKEALKYASSLEMNIIPYEDARGMEYAKSIISQIKGKKSLGIFIGPEGGFTEDEVKLAVEMGANVITLGHRILRTETASLAILSIVMFEIEKD